MSTEGVNNIQYVCTIWQTLNRKEPTITNIVFDGKTAVVHLIHNLSPTILPSFVQLQIPAITTLSFRETECDSGLLKIYKQQDSWTLEGLLQSVPLVSYWYNNVLRVVMGKLLTTAGDIVDSSISYAQKMSIQGREIQHYGHELAIENMEKLEEYRSGLETHYLEGLKNWKQDSYLPSSIDDALSPIKETNQGC
ncbi:hypothetical protein CU098_009291 [Rhizopus stolonifer]|uniref:Uncharacterized protein n=2 Tax=Mucorineae TaxID=1344963 RepID=A0A367KJ32_RHIST|nr:hypothetical protein CU098_009291 [Rhizopus stolonifer]